MLDQIERKLTPRPAGVLIAGPTASGKSDLAIGLALALEREGRRGVIINADSAQVYADLRILSARPAVGEMQGIEHRLFGNWDGGRACSAADWAQAATREIASCHDEGAVPILVGGTGLYIRTLLEGIAPIPPIDEAVRAEVRSLAVGDAYAALQQEDPARASLLKPQDATRIARALEVVRSTGLPLAEWQLRREGGIENEVSLQPVILLPPRETLYRRCDERFGLMLDSGAVDEVEALLARRLDPDLPVMRAIGVREIAGLIRGEWDCEEALMRGAQATRNYAKRQYTWLRHQFPPSWPRLESCDYAISRNFETLLHN